MSQTPQDRPTNSNTPREANLLVPPPPREVTPKIRRQAWREPKIRAAVVGGVIVLIALVYLAITSVIDWRRENQLFSNGVIARATAFVSGVTAPNRLIKSDYPLDISYAYDGRTYKVNGSLADAEATKYYTGQPFDVRIDPANPTHWTTGKEGMPLYTRLVGVYILSACATGILAAAIFWHMRKVRLWKMGEVADAIIDSLGQSALAPRSTVARCHLAIDRRDATIFQIFIPPSVVVPPVGGRIRLICHPANPSHYLVADAYVG